MSKETKSTHDVWYTIYPMWDKNPASGNYIKIWLITLYDCKIIHRTIVRELNKEICH